MNLLKRFPIISFFVIAFGLDWIIRIAMNLTIQIPPLKLLGEYAPALAAIVVIAALQGKGDVRALLSRVRIWRLNPLWYILVLVGPAVLGLVAIGLFILFRGPGVQFQFPGLAGLLISLVIGFVSSLGEEIGWRGFAFPRLQSRSNLLVAGLIVGVLWGVWHFPDDITSLSLLTTPSTYISFLWFLGLTVTGSVFMGWVYNRTRGSILLMTFAHMGLTLFWNFVILPQNVHFDQSNLYVILMGIVVVMLLVFTGVKHVAPARQAQEELAGVAVAEAQERSE